MKFSGMVIEGDKRGTALGFPTANLDTNIDLDPGVYAVWVHHLGERLEGVLCFGVKDAAGDMKCEVHLLDYVGNLYGCKLSIEVVGGRLSEIQELPDQDALRRKIEQDILKARLVLTS
ncbi:TPA: hypothetical protein DDZ10_00840 [Candidatus Uhrbacteria bacterium]|uniref:riboflavin kinase n=1 Tax=Candidatus Uhrbacteria bacterium GW2011_GWC2_53_7 TaxID=1618986 RepID=A0A0G1XVS2_9BACT|nr:MAG: hypothetical protein UY82_C0051G0004 [Candidatus Uhrbacteria bacterium GW2011_GWC2_53_7]HBL39201.1 hypothetical protein [Candidatus Uhrbacteria bacterium]